MVGKDSYSPPPHNVFVFVLFFCRKFFFTTSLFFSPPSYFFSNFKVFFFLYSFFSKQFIFPSLLKLLFHKQCYFQLASSPGPFPAFPAFQHATLKSWERAWGQG